jgi:hypothetical protein
MDWLYKKRTLSFMAMLFFVLTGTYNAIVINSESHLNGADMRFVKRLDELNGIVEPGRLVATGVQWQKLEAAPVVTQNALHAPVIQEVKTVAAASSSEIVQEPPAAAITEELNLNLIEVINPKKWQNGLPPDQFSGSLSTANGSIDSLNVSLPGGEGVTVSFAEMNGNVFEYDIEGEVYSGMLYQMDQNAYMVTLTNGPLEGTRLRFVGEVSQQQVEENIQIATGNTGADEFGNPGEQVEQVEQQGVQAQAEEAPPVPEPAPEQMVNFEQPVDPDAQFQQQGMQEIQQQNNT